jgi:hypothetical protein
MSPEARVQAVVDFGFTERQARFLVLVMRHAGVCVPRQYASFAGAANGGKKCNAFFSRLVRRGFAVACDCVHNRARLYHLHHRALYCAIGEMTSRYSRPVPPRLAVERLMLLDALLASGDHDWLTSATERRAYLPSMAGSVTADQSHDVPANLAPERRSVGSDRFPIGIDSTGRTILVYLATEPTTDSFRAFLQGNAGLLKTVSAWTIRLAFPRPLDRFYHAYQSVIHEELESPLHPATINELKWYFEHRREANQGPVHPQTQGFLDVGARVFAAPRFTALYRRWLKQGDTVFEAISSPEMADALAAGTGRVECCVLSHSYRHLSPLVTRPSDSVGVEKGAARGATSCARSQHPSSTPRALSGSSQLL